MWTPTKIHTITLIAIMVIGNITIVLAAQTLDCVKCDSLIDPACTDLAYEPGSIPHGPCKADARPGSYAQCSKSIEIRSENGTDVTHTSRACMLGSILAPEEFCEERLYLYLTPNLKAIICGCTSKLCNGATSSKSQASHALLAFGIARSTLVAYLRR